MYIKMDLSSVCEDSLHGLSKEEVYVIEKWLFCLRVQAGWSHLDPQINIDELFQHVKDIREKCEEQ